MRTVRCLPLCIRKSVWTNYSHYFRTVNVSLSHETWNLFHLRQLFPLSFFPSVYSGQTRQQCWHPIRHLSDVLTQHQSTDHLSSFPTVRAHVTCAPVCSLWLPWLVPQGQERVSLRLLDRSLDLAHIGPYLSVTVSIGCVAILQLFALTLLGTWLQSPGIRVVCRKDAKPLVSWPSDSLPAGRIPTA